MHTKPTYCPNCYAEITHKRNQTNKLFTSCASCKTTFSIYTAVSETYIKENPTSPIEWRQQNPNINFSRTIIVPQEEEILNPPDNVQLEKTLQYLSMDFQKRNVKILILLGILGRGFFITFFFVMLYLAAYEQPLSTIRIISHFPLLIIVLLVLLRKNIIAFVNKTNIHVDDKRIYITRQPPILCWTSKKMPTKLVKAIFVEGLILKGAGEPYEYSIVVRLSNGEENTLISDINSVESALYIKQEIQKYLDIPKYGGIA